MSETILRSPLLLSATESVLLVVDAQEKLLNSIPQSERIVWNIERLLSGAEVLKVPSLATEQYPQGLGPTHAALLPYLGKAAGQQEIPSKLTFSCAGCAECVDALQSWGRRQVVIAGLETHVCVLQTSFDLLTAGYDVYLCVDALGTRFSIDHQTALRRLDGVGATLTTTEGVLFEWCQCAGTAEFKRISQIVRQPAPAGVIEN